MTLKLERISGMRGMQIQMSGALRSDYLDQARVAVGRHSRVGSHQASQA